MQDLSIRRASTQARAALEEGASRCLVLKTLAELGGHGKHQQNVERDFNRRFCPEVGGLEPYEIPITINRRSGEEGTEVIMFPLFACHEMVAAMWDYSPDVFEHCLLGDSSPDDLLKFWKNEADKDWVSTHPVFSLNTSDFDWQCTLPICFFGDKVEYLNDNQACAYSWSSTMAHGGSAYDQIQPMCFLPEDWCCEATSNQIHEFMVWDAQMLLHGKFPDEAYPGTPALKVDGRRYNRRGRRLAGPWKFAYDASLGDQPWNKDVYKQKRAFNMNFACPRCFASKVIPGLELTDASLHAGWTYTCEEHEHWLINNPEDSRSPLTKIPGWWSTRVVFDIMHVVYLFHFTINWKTNAIKLVRRYPPGPQIAPALNWPPGPKT